MRNRNYLWTAVAIVALLSAPALAGSRGIEFTPLGFYDDTVQFPYSGGFDVTADGSKVAGVVTPYGGCIVWDEVGGWEYLGATSQLCYMSDDGTEFASRVFDVQGRENAAIWTGGENWQILTPQAGAASCDASYTGTFAISGDGGTVGGLTWAGCGWARGFTSDKVNPMVPMLGILDDSSRVNGFNYDGSVAVGWNRIPWGGWQATKWVNGVPEWIGTDTYDDPWIGEAWVASNDGSVTAGSAGGQIGFSNSGWIHDDTNGLRLTGTMPWGWFFDQGYNFGMNGDGSMTVGRFGFGPFSVATMWTEATGLIDLNEFLINQGRTEPFDGWVLTQASDVSDDGTVIVGSANNPDGWVEAYKLDISKVAICHAPPGNPGNARTISISWGSVGDHVAHGDFLGTCEAAAGGFARSYNHPIKAMHEMNAGSLRDRLPRPGDSHTPGFNSLITGDGSAVRALQLGLESNVTEADPIGDRGTVRNGRGKQR